MTTPPLNHSGPPRPHPFRDLAVAAYVRPVQLDSPDVLVRWRPSLLWSAALLLAAALLGN